MISNDVTCNDFYVILSSKLLPGCFARAFTDSGNSNAWDLYAIK